MTCRKNQPHRTFLRTGFPALLLAFLVCFLPGSAWADCELVSFRKYLDKKYSGIGAIVIAKAGSILDASPTSLIADGPEGGFHSNGEIRTYGFSALSYVMGEGPEKIKVESTYWDIPKDRKGNLEDEKRDVYFTEGANYLLFLRPWKIPYFENIGCSPPEKSVKARWKMFFLEVYFQKLSDDDSIKKLWEELSQLIPEAKLEREKYRSGNFPRYKALQRLFQITERELERIPDYPLKIMTEIFGLLAERNEEFEEILFEYFKGNKNRLSASFESEIKRRRNWMLLQASALSWFHKDSVNKVLIPYLAEELKGPDSRRAEYVLSNIGTEEARIETRKFFRGKR